MVESVGPFPKKDCSVPQFGLYWTYNVMQLPRWGCGYLTALAPPAKLARVTSFYGLLFLNTKWHW